MDHKRDKDTKLWMGLALFSDFEGNYSSFKIEFLYITAIKANA